MNCTLKSVWSCTVFKKSTSLFIPNVIPTSLMQGYITLKIQVVLKACHSLQSHLISREPSTSNYLTLTSCWIKWSLRSDRYSKHIQGKCGTANKSWALLQKEHRGSRRDSKQREGWLGSGVDSWAGSKGWARPGLDLSLSPGSRVPAADYKMCSGCCFQRAQVLLMTAYFWIPGANAWSVMTFRGVFTRPASD